LYLFFVYTCRGGNLICVAFGRSVPVRRLRGGSGAAFPACRARRSRWNLRLARVLGRRRRLQSCLARPIPAPPSDGLRLRAATGFGEYSYVGERNAREQSFSAQTGFADALVGYLERLGPLTAKAFVGISAIEHDVRPFDPQNPVQGRAYGPKGVIELWLNMGDSAWSSIDASWTSAHETYAGRLRTGYRLFDDVSFGLEARINGNALDKDARGGAFIR
jgi:hypothetical protein